MCLTKPTLEICPGILILKLNTQPKILNAKLGQKVLQMAQGISKQPVSSKQRKLKSRDRFLAESKADLLFNKSRPPPKKAQKSNNKPTKREKQRQLRDLYEFPGLKKIISQEALALRPGEGILEFLNAKNQDEPEELELETHITTDAEAQTGTSTSSGEGSKEEDFISLDFDNETEMGKKFVEYEAEGNKYANEFPCPWIGNKGQPGKDLSLGECLAAEVLEFLRYMSPTKAEVKKRDECVNRLRRVVKQLWPDATVSVFGSYATGMYLPDADIDVVIMSNEMRSKLKSEMYRLSSRLKSNQIVQSINVISHARVPIIKYVEAGSGLNVDIAFSQNGGIDTVNRVSGWLDSNKALKPLAMIIRQFLKSRNLSDVATGGLGGYATLCLVYSRLQQRSLEIQGGPLRNVGILLLDFFDFYGHLFDNTAQYVRPQEHPKCNPLAKRVNGSMATPQAAGLAIEDPNDSKNNISKATYNYPTIKRSFGNAADYLKSICLGWQKFSSTQKAEFSFLGPLLKFEGSEPLRSKQTLNRALSTIRLQQTSPSSESKAASPQPKTAPLRTAPPLRTTPAKTAPAKTASAETAPAKTPTSNSAALSERKRTPPDGHNNSVEKGRGVARFDPFNSSSQQIAEIKTERPGGTPKGKRTHAQTNEDKKHSRSESEDEEDSRTKLTAAQRRQFWNRKAGTPEAAPAS